MNVGWNLNDCDIGVRNIFYDGKRITHTHTHTHTQSSGSLTAFWLFKGRGMFHPDCGMKHHSMIGREQSQVFFTCIFLSHYLCGC